MSFSINKIDKPALLQLLCRELHEDLAALVRRQHDTQSAATHEENRAEHSKDTRATEQSYLARGLAARVADLRQTVAQIGRIETRQFDSSDPIAVMALVAIRVEQEREVQFWWLVPAAAGRELVQQRVRIRTVTPTAPLGRALLGLHVDDEESFTTPGGRRSFEILEIA
jgi:transcription elongation GreA/GreB family factor